MQLLALAYAMAHGGQDMPWDRDQARKAIRVWAKTLHCRASQIEEAVRQIHDQDETDLGCVKNTGSPDDLAKLSVALAAVTQSDPEIWERRACLSYAVAVMDRITELNTSNAGAPSSDEDQLKKSRALKAEYIMGKYIARIRRRHEKAATHG